jgi:hypothetical protein
MTLLADIRKMQAEGRTEPEIISELNAKGVSPREITEALSQSKIKEAVEGGYPVQPEGQAPVPQAEQPQAYGEMTPSLAQQQEEYPQAQQAPAVQQAYAPEQAYQPEAQAQPPAEYEYPQYQQPAALSTDTLAQISEQIVDEKLSPLRKELEKVLDLKTTLDAKMEYLDERLKRIEKIIDRFQLSVLQKVGDYMTNIDDIKREIIETQKSFKAMSSSQAVNPKKPSVHSAPPSAAVKPQS